jgi:Asp-tRNA(Asn)/Glu-tRNA(Gln) amidotransferase A subunit family amidase
MTRSAHDAALVLNAMAGYDRLDSASVDRPVEDFTANLSLDLHGIRIGIPTTYFTEPLQPEVESAWRAAIEALVSLGATPVEVKFTTLDDAVDTGTTISRSEMTTFHREWYARQPEDYSQGARDRFQFGNTLGAVRYVEAQRARGPIRQEMWTVFDQVDVLVTPAQPTTAGVIGSETMEVDGVVYDTVSSMTRFTYPFNLSGFPAMSIPCGFDRQGLPIGLQLAAAAWQEALLLGVAHQYQQATDWHQRRPTLAAASSA